MDCWVKRLEYCSGAVFTASAVLPPTKPWSSSKLTDHSSDAESRTRLSILVGKSSDSD